MKRLSVLMIIIGVVVLSVGMCMLTKQNTFVETVEGDRTEWAMMGASVGAGAGAGAGAAIGGIGIAACGTGVGIPAGVVCLGLGAILGLVGGGIGACVGTPDQTVPVVIPAYSPWEYWIVIFSGAIIMVVGIYLFRMAGLKDASKSGPFER